MKATSSIQGQSPAPSLLRSLVRKALPLSIRNRVWHARREGARVTCRKLLRKARVAAGLPIAKVRLEEGPIFVDVRDAGIGQVIFDRREYEPNETVAITQNLRPGSRFVDIGANIGYFSLLASKLVGPHGRVIAIEPEAHNFRLLSRNIAESARSNVTAVNAALGANDGSAVLQRSPTNFGDHRISGRLGGRESQIVPVRTLDGVLSEAGLESIDFVKIDVQGYECHVLGGMRHLFEAGRPLTLLCEFWPEGMKAAGGDPAEFLRIFKTSGFEAALLEPGGIETPVPVESLAEYLPPFDPNEPDGCFVNVLFRRGTCSNA